MSPIMPPIYEQVLFVSALTLSVGRRIALVRRVDSTRTPPPALKLADDAEAQISFALDLWVFAVSVPYLLWYTHFHSRCSWHDLDTNRSTPSPHSITAPYFHTPSPHFITTLHHRTASKRNNRVHLSL